MSKEPKIYKSQLGLSFSIVPYPRQSEGDVVFFTKEEFDYIKIKKFTPEEFKFAWDMKRKDCNFQVITPEEKKEIQTEAQKLAQFYVPQILQRLKRTSQE